MSKKSKIIILTVVLGAVIGILVMPYFFTEERTFAATPQPYQTYQKAREDGRSIFLEFYADW